MAGVSSLSQKRAFISGFTGLRLYVVEHRIDPGLETIEILTNGA